MGKKSILLGIPRTLDSKSTTANSSREIKNRREPKKPTEWLKNLYENPKLKKKNKREKLQKKNTSRCPRTTGKGSFQHELKLAKDIKNKTKQKMASAILI